MRGSAPSSPEPSIAERMGRPAVPPGSPSSEKRYSEPTWEDEGGARGADDS